MPLSPEEIDNEVQRRTRINKKIFKAFLFAILSIIPGLGHVFQKRFLAAILWFIAFIIFCSLSTPQTKIYFIVIVLSAIHSVYIYWKAQAIPASELLNKAKLPSTRYIMDYKIALKYFSTVCKNGENVRRDDNETIWVGKPLLVQFTYSDADENETVRKVGIYRLSMNFFKDLYLTGYCFTRKEERTFKALRILSDITYQGKEIPLDEWINDNFDPNKSLRKVKKTKAEAPANNSTIEELEQWAKMKDKGIITQEEFDAKKKKLLDI